MPSRRSFLAQGLVLPMTGLILPAQASRGSDAEDRLDFSGAEASPASDVRVEIAIEGSLLVGFPPILAQAARTPGEKPAAEGKTGTADAGQPPADPNAFQTGQIKAKAPLKVTGKLDYTQARQSGSLAWGRKYRTAEAKLEVQGTEKQRQLRSERTLIAAQLVPGKLEFRGATGYLTADEADLIHAAADPLCFPALLPTSPLSVGEAWTPPLEVLAPFCGLEVVTQGDVTGRLVRVHGSFAELELSGNCEGAFRGVASRIELRSRIAMTRTTKEVVGLTLALREQRAIGVATPGIDAVTQLRVTKRPLDRATELSADELKLLAETVFTGETLFEAFAADGQMQFVHDARCTWLDVNQDRLTFRVVDANTLLAHANLARLPEYHTQRRMTLEEFQEDVRQSLHGYEFEFLSARTATTAAGLECLATVVAGKANNVPLEWRFFHVCDPQGRRASLSFVVPLEQAERLGGLDQSLAESLAFLDTSASQPAAPEVKAPAVKTTQVAPNLKTAR